MAKMTASKKTRKLPSDESVCPECGEQVVTDYDRGERHCDTCGLIVDSDMISHGQEYRVYSEEQKNRHRVGPPESETLHDKGLSTKIDHSMRDSHGRPLSSAARREVHRLMKWQHKLRISNSQERNLIYALQEINKKASQLELTADVQQETAHLYRRAVSENIIRGRSITSVIAASFYLAGRICGHPRTLDEIAREIGVSRKECGRIARFMKRKFKLKVDPPTADDFLERFCQMMDLPNKLFNAQGILCIFARSMVCIPVRRLWDLWRRLYTQRWSKRQRVR